MDFKDWKKVCEDGKTCTLVHPKGHTMTIAMKAIPAIHREQIKRLKFADGGKVSDDVLASGEGGTSEQGKDVRTAHEMRTDGSHSEHSAKTHEKFAKAEAKGRAQMERIVKPKMKGLAEGGEVKNYDEGTPNGSVQDSQGDTTHNGSPININIGTPSAQDQMSSGQATPAAPVAPAPMSAPNMQAPMLSDQTLNAPAAVQQQQQAIGQQQGIDSQKAQAQVGYEKEFLEKQADIAQQQQDHYNELKQHTDEFKDYMSANPIDPMHFQENRSGMQKAGTALGLLLGGFSTPFTHQANPALEFLNKQIDRDIESQKFNANTKKNIWGAYHDLYGDSNVATNLAKISANDILTHRASMMAAQLGTQQAQATANALGAQKQIENNQLLLDSAGRLGTLRTGGGGTSNVSQPGNKSSGPQAANKNVDWYEDHILAPNADAAAAQLQFNPLAKPNLAAIYDQKTKADLADKAIATINETFPRLAQNTNGAMGYIHNRGVPILGTLPWVGDAINSGARFATDTGRNREYDSDYSQIVGAVRGALQGNVSEDLLDRTVRDNTPLAEDSAELKKKKMDALKKFVKAHTKTDLLRTFKLSKS